MAAMLHAPLCGACASYTTQNLTYKGLLEFSPFPIDLPRPQCQDQYADDKRNERLRGIEEPELEIALLEEHAMEHRRRNETEPYDNSGSKGVAVVVRVPGTGLEPARP